MALVTKLRHFDYKCDKLVKSFLFSKVFRFEIESHWVIAFNNVNCTCLINKSLIQIKLYDFVVGKNDDSAVQKKIKPILALYLKYFTPTKSQPQLFSINKTNIKSSVKKHIQTNLN